MNYSDRFNSAWFCLWYRSAPLGVINSAFQRCGTVLVLLTLETTSTSRRAMEIYPVLSSNITVRMQVLGEIVRDTRLEECSFVGNSML